MQQLRRMISMVLSLVLVAGTPGAAFAANRLEAMSFWDANNGYVVGVNGTQGFFARTWDGGLTWHYQRDVQWGDAIASGPDGTGSIAFQDSSSGETIRTADGGLSWASGGDLDVSGTKAKPWDIERLSNGRLVAVGMTEGAANGIHYLGDLGFINVSSDQGVTWSRAFEGPIIPRANEDANQIPSFAGFADVDEAPLGGLVLAAGYEYTNSDRNSLKGRLLVRSVDGGTTWENVTPVTTTLNASYRPRAVTVASSGVAYVFADAGIYTKTTDGASSWLISEFSTPEHQIKAGAERASLFVSYAADSLTANTVVVAGRWGNGTPVPYAGRIYYTTDGGTTWLKPALPAGTLALRDVKMLTAQRWIAVGDDETVIITENAGQNWTRVAREPVVQIATPAPGFQVPNTTPVPISITATDAISGVTSVHYTLRRTDGRYWSGSDWVQGITWLSAQQSGGSTQWTAQWTPTTAFVQSGTLLTVTARATDRFGTSKTSAAVVSSKYVADETSLAVKITSPAQGFSLDTMTERTVTMTATDVAGTVDVQVEDSSGRYWGPSGWSTTPSWHAASNLPAGTDQWSAQWTPDAEIMELGLGVTVRARARDAALAEAMDSVDSAPAAVDRNPEIAIQAPLVGFSLSGTGMIYTHGTASDAHSAVTVDVLVSDESGRFWSPSGWTTTETWRPANLTGGTWSISWAPDAKILEERLRVTVAARARDAFQNSEDADPVESALPTAEQKPNVAIQAPLAGFPMSGWNPVYTQGTASDALSPVSRVEVLIRDTSGRYWGPSGWTTTPAWRPTNLSGTTWNMSWTPDAEILERRLGVSITARAFDSFGNERSTGTVWSATPSPDISPRIAITSPKAGFYVTSTATQRLTGTASDAQSSVRDVSVSILRSDGLYWSGSGWVTGERWLAAPLTTATTWALSWTPDSAFVKSGRAVTIRAKARDAYGHESLIASVSSAKRVKASLTRPTRSTYTLKRGTSYKVTGYLKPRHVSGTYPVKIYTYRYKNGKYSYYKSFKAKATNYTSSTGAKSSKYTASIKLPYKGKWRMRAYHTDAPHLPTYSSYRYVTVR